MAKRKSEQGLNENRKTRVFISYSRADSDFTENLRDRLIESGFDAFLDKHDILPGEPWQERLGGLIATADTVVFCMSPDSIDSEMCDWEVNEAERLAKRILPVVIEDPDDKSVPQRLKRLNYIFLRNEAEQALEYTKLIEMLDSDIGWIRRHTRFSELAARWEANNYPRDMVLRGKDLIAAETWLITKPKKAPDTTAVHRAFISESRRAATRRQRITVGLSITSAVVATILSSLAFWQSEIAQTEKSRAIDALGTQSRLITNAAQEQMDAGMYLEGILLALEVLPDQNSRNFLRREWPTTPEAHMQLVRGFSGFWSLATFSQRAGSTRCARFEPTGKYLVTCSYDDAAILWDRQSGNVVREFLGHTDAVVDAAFNRDGGKIATGSADGTLRIWDVKSGGQLHSFLVNPLKSNTSVSRVFFGARDQFVVSFSKERGNDQLETHVVRFWDLKNKSAIKRSVTFKSHVMDISLSPDGKLVAVSLLDNSVRILRASDGDEVWRLDLKKSAPGIDFNPAWNRRDSYQLAIPNSDENRINIVELKFGNGPSKMALVSRMILRVNTGYQVASAYFANDGTKLITLSSSFGRVEIWNLRTGKSIATAYQLTSQRFGKPEFDPQGTSFVTPNSRFGPVIWPVEKIGPTFLGSGQVTSFSKLSPNGHLAAMSTYQPGIKLYNVETGHLIHTLKGHVGGGPRSINFDRLSKLLVSASDDGSVRIWDTRTGTSKKSWYPMGPDAAHPIAEAILSPDGKRLLVRIPPKNEYQYLDKKQTSEHKLVLWDTETEREIAILAVPTSRAPPGSSIKVVNKAGSQLMAFSNDGATIVAALADGTAVIWDGVTGEYRAKIGRDHEALNSAVFSPDGQRIVISSTAGLAELWTVKGKLIKVLEGHTSSVLHGAFSPRGTVIATISADRTIRLWNGHNGSVLRVLKGHTDTIHSIEFSSDSRRLITASQDATARIWDVAMGLEIAQLRLDRNNNFRSAQFGPESNMVMAISGVDTVIWKNVPTLETPLQNLIERAKRDVPRCLTKTQRRVFFLPPEPPRWCIEQKKWPYQTSAWQDWLIAHDNGEQPPMP